MRKIFNGQGALLNQAKNVLINYRDWALNIRPKFIEYPIEARKAWIMSGKHKLMTVSYLLWKLFDPMFSDIGRDLEPGNPFNGNGNGGNGATGNGRRRGNS